jgi:excisionase family DNA binding protein
MQDIIVELQTLKSLIIAQGILKKDVLKFDEACSYSGISKSHMYKLTSGGRIPFYKPGGKLVFFKRSELDEWLLQNRSSTQEELDKIAENWVTKQGRRAR